MKIENLLGPSYIDNPNMIEDIQRFFNPGFSKSNFDSLSDAEQVKLKNVTNRFEYITHIDKLITLLKDHKQINDTELELINNHTLRIKNHELINFHNQEFTGFDYDLEATNLYLLLTCVDTIKANKSYIDSFTFLKNYLIENNTIDSSEINVLEAKYLDEYGVSRNFVSAFTEDISYELKERFTNNFFVLKFDDDEINRDSWNSWKNKEMGEKLKKLANIFYSIRSKYTHEAVLGLIPNSPVYNHPYIKQIKLVSLKDGEILNELLNDTIIFLVNKILLR